MLRKSEMVNFQNKNNDFKFFLKSILSFDYSYIF